MDIIINAGFKKTSAAAVLRKKKGFSFFKTHTFKNSEFLADVIDKLFKKNNFDYRAVKRIAVFTGPGSYTGIRCAIAYAKGFKAVYKNVKLRGVSLFDAAPYIKKSHGDFDFLMDIRAGKFLILNNKKNIVSLKEIDASKKYYVFENTRAFSGFKTVKIEITPEFLNAALPRAKNDIEAVYLTGPVRCI